MQNIINYLIIKLGLDFETELEKLFIYNEDYIKQYDNTPTIKKDNRLYLIQS